jgi:hypothetical protein
MLQLPALDAAGTNEEGGGGRDCGWGGGRGEKKGVVGEAPAS